MFELIHNYRTKCLLQGPDRALLLQKVLAASIAYAAPCSLGEATDVDAAYMLECNGKALKAISAVNEHIFINTDEVLADVASLWKSRYLMVNSPFEEGAKVMAFHASMKTVGVDLSTHYQYWVNQFTLAMKTFFVQCDGGV